MIFKRVRKIGSIGQSVRIEKKLIKHGQVSDIKSGFHNEFEIQIPIEVGKKITMYPDTEIDTEILQIQNSDIPNLYFVETTTSFYEVELIVNEN